MYFSEKLGNIVSFRTGKLNSNAAVENGKYPFFTCSQETFKTNTFSFDTECVLLAGNNANGIYPLKYFKGKFDAYQRTYIIEPLDKNKLSIRFLYYLLRPTLELFRSVSTGAATKFLTLGILKETSVLLPPLPTQQKIASILSAYDDLIENNTRRIQILEEMARRIYEEWFVHFRFPNHENIKRVDSELGLIPDGWEVVTLDEVSLLISRGISPKYDDTSEKLVINQKCVRGEKLNLELARRHISKTPDNKLIQYGDVLINSTGVGTLGRVAQVYFNISNYTVDSHITIVRPKKEINKDFFGLSLLRLQPHFDRLGFGATGQTELSRTNVSNTKILLPMPEIQELFSNYVSSIRKNTILLIKKNENLKQTRDLLLPKLISGEIDVSEFPEP